MVATEDTVHAGRLAVLGIAGIIAIYAIVVLLQALYLAGATTEQETKVMAVPYAETEAALEAQATTLDGYGVVSVGEAGDVLHLPLDLAKERVLEDLR